jgi:predicted O-methyltransferase YrrM
MECSELFDYPHDLAVTSANQATIDFIRTTPSRIVAEIGIYKGYTSEKLAEFLAGEGELHLFDYKDRVVEVKSKLNAAGYQNIIGHGNSRKLMDSYNWSLMRMLEAHPEPIFDYVFIDGAHIWAIDALAFSLADRLLKVGGYIDFDDYNWSLEKSPSLNPSLFPPTSEMYTAEQIREQHIKLVVDLLVKRDPRYVEVLENKIYKKIGPTKVVSSINYHDTPSA